MQAFEQIGRLPVGKIPETLPRDDGTAPTIDGFFLSLPVLHQMDPCACWLANPSFTLHPSAHVPGKLIAKYPLILSSQVKLKLSEVEVGGSSRRAQPYEK